VLYMRAGGALALTTIAGSTDSFAPYESDYNASTGNWTNAFDNLDSNSAGLIGASRTVFSNSAAWRIDTDSFAPYESDYNASTGNWTNAYNDLNSNSRGW